MSKGLRCRSGADLPGLRHKLRGAPHRPTRKLCLARPPPLQLPAGATLWTVQHLPQNRDVFMVGAGDGSLALYKYHYPDKRWVLVGRIVTISCCLLLGALGPAGHGSAKGAHFTTTVAAQSCAAGTPAAHL